MTGDPGKAMANILSKWHRNLHNHFFYSKGDELIPLALKLFESKILVQILYATCVD